MKSNFVAGLLLISFVGLAGFCSCNKATYTRSDTKADSAIYLLTVDSVSIPIKLSEIGDFPLYSKGFPYRFTIPSDSLNYKDTKYLHFLNGQMIDGRERDKILRKLKNEDIKSVELMPAEQAIELYGQKASNGVVFIVTWKKG